MTLSFRFAKSINYEQLKGNIDVGRTISESYIKLKFNLSEIFNFEKIDQLEKSCGDSLRIKDMIDSNTVAYSASGIILDQNEFACPCGLIAKSFFNGYFFKFLNFIYRCRFIHSL